MKHAGYRDMTASTQEARVSVLGCASKKFLRIFRALQIDFPLPYLYELLIEGPERSISIVIQRKS